MIKINRVCIENLHDNKTIDIQNIQENKLILVGENGTGKTTVANFIFFLLTGQWWKLIQYTFDYVLININGQDLILTYEELDIFKEKLKEELYRDLWHIERHIERRRSSRESRVSRSEFVLDGDEIDTLERRLPGAIEKAVKRKNLYPVVFEKIKDLTEDLFIFYLPTYRRVERELVLKEPNRTRIFVEDDLEDEFTDTPKDKYLELIVFGMSDVETLFKKKMETLSGDLRKGVVNAVMEYFRDIILYRYEEPISDELKNIEPSDIENMLKRVSEDILTKDDKSSMMEKIYNQEHKSKPEVGHFLLKLSSLFIEQDKSESTIRDLVEKCNEYLIGKKIIFDNSDYKIKINPERGEKPIELNQLSSGEKQLISLLSHIYLTDNKNYFIIIDEPELSLSVPWQRKFLPDILSANKSIGLVAVTHSPFIYDNELENFVYSLEDFVG